MELNILMDLCSDVAIRNFGGHLTIMRFTTGWKAWFGTPSFDPEEMRAGIAGLPSYPALEWALRSLLINRSMLP